MRNKLLRKIINYFKSLKYKKYDIGEYTYGFPKIFTFNDSGKFKIGKFCSFAPNVTIIVGGHHSLRKITTYPIDKLIFGRKEPEDEDYIKHDLIIGNDVWVGYGSTILSDLTIGDGAIIGAMSVITKDVAPYSIVAGNPAREIRKRFSDETIKKLLEYQWWNKGIEHIKNNKNTFALNFNEEERNKL